MLGILKYTLTEFGYTLSMAISDNKGQDLPKVYLAPKKRILKYI